MKVAIVHYWFTGMRGGEKVVEALCEMFPSADLFTHVAAPETLSPVLRRHRLRTSFIQRLPGARRSWQRYLPLMPMALERLDLRGYDLVISSESGPAKGVIVPPEAVHVCYCHSPMRYLWDMRHEYLESAGKLTRLFAPAVLHYLRLWDVSTASRVDRFIANSAFVQSRIRRYYRRGADVVHPPVDVGRFAPGSGREDFYLVAGQLVPYKRVDLAVDAFSRSGRSLVVIGQGPEQERLRRRAGPTVTFLGWQPDEVLRDHYARCRALVFPGLEDFGIVPVEAMASGSPLIAYGKGGARETVIDGRTGVHFHDQTPEALNGAVERFEGMEDRFVPERLVAHARAYGKDRFQAQMWERIEEALQAETLPGGADAAPTAMPRPTAAPAAAGDLVPTMRGMG